MMKIVGVMLARNEDWIIGLSLRAALLWCDEVVVLDHGSTDGTPGIVAEVQREHEGRITLMRWPFDGAWLEADARQATLDAARRRGATHVAIVDADEALTGNWLGSIRDLFDDLMPGEVIALPMVSPWRSMREHRVDKCVWTQSMLTLGFCDDANVAYMTHDGYHHHCRAPHGHRRVVHPLGEGSPKYGGAMHLQWVDWKRVQAKHAWYKMMETVRYPGRKTPEELNAMYGQALDERGLKTESLPADWLAPYVGFPAPRSIESWHVAECQRLLREYGADAFKGLDLFGVV